MYWRPGLVEVCVSSAAVTWELAYLILQEAAQQLMTVLTLQMMMLAGLVGLVALAVEGWNRHSPGLALTHGR